MAMKALFKRVATCFSVALVVSAVSLANAQAGTWYSVPYSPDLYKDNGIVTFIATPAEFNEDSNPTIILQSTYYQKLPWSSVVFGVSSFPTGAYYRGLTLAEYQSAGSPPAQTTPLLGANFFRWPTSNADMYWSGPDRVVRLMTPAEYSAAGSPSLQTQANKGFQKLSWNSNIAYMYNVSSGTGVKLEYYEWADMALPVAQNVSRFPNDTLCTNSGSSTVYYYGPTYSGPITLSQYQAAGSPAPSAC